MSNYPPGAKNDPRAPYNQESHEHEHEWRDEEIIFEDGAAHLSEYCEYVEGRWGEGYKCEESRHRRFEPTTLTLGDYEYEIPDVHNRDHDRPRNRIIVNLFWKVERAAWNDKGKIVDVQPREGSGSIVYKYQDMTVRFEEVA